MEGNWNLPAYIGCTNNNNSKNKKIQKHLQNRINIQTRNIKLQGMEFNQERPQEVEEELEEVTLFSRQAVAAMLRPQFPPL